MNNVNANPTVLLDGERLRIEDVVNVAEKGYKVDFSEETWEKISEFRKGLEEYLYEHPEKPIYGVTRGCGDLLTSVLKKEEWEKYIEAYKNYKNELTNIEKERKRKEVFKQYLEALEDYQLRYIQAHNCGTGNPLPIEIVRAVMVIRLNSFAKGYSAVRPQTCQLMIDMLNKGVTPWVLEEGSVGASGDLVPLAMIGAVLLGLPEAKAYYKRELMSASEALAKADLTPINLGAKEAMALTNGSNLIAALAVFATRDAENILKTASISTAFSLEAIRGEKNAFSKNIAEMRPHKGHIYIADQIRKLLEESKRTSKEAQEIPYPRQITSDERDKIQKMEEISEKEEFKDAVNRLLEGATVAGERIQDRYSFRAVPQVHGAVYEALEKLKEVVFTEINSATDNPLFFKDETGRYQAISGANFHGQPLAVVIDYLKLALTGLALITNKRTFSLLDKAQNFGLPGDLVADSSGGDTGLMIAQYAGAARAAESRILSTPASIMSISTAANQEDIVSMGTIGAFHLHKVLYNTQIVVSIELLCALRGLQMTYDLLPDSLKPLGQGTSRVYEFLNKLLPPVKRDQYLRIDMEKIVKLIQSGDLLREVML
jgi:histidine ammonia-lyase